jgi:ribose-phosphate pyrophosphokinase
VLSGPAVERLRDSPIVELVTTDTVPVPPEKRLDNLTVLSVAPMLAETIARIHTGGSVGALFEANKRGILDNT